MGIFLISPHERYVYWGNAERHSIRTNLDDILRGPRGGTLRSKIERFGLVTRVTDFPRRQVAPAAAGFRVPLDRHRTLVPIFHRHLVNLRARDSEYRSLAAQMYYGTPSPKSCPVDSWEFSNKLWAESSSGPWLRTLTTVDDWNNSMSTTVRWPSRVSNCMLQVSLVSFLGSHTTTPHAVARFLTSCSPFQSMCCSNAANAFPLS